MNLKNKSGYYGFLDGFLLKIIRKDNNWYFTTKDKVLINNYNFKNDGLSHKLQINDDKNINAYRMSIYCFYKDLKFAIENWNGEKILLYSSFDETKIALGYHPYSDPRIEVDIDEIPIIWEERTPIEGFKFDVEPIFYLKKR
ncbi:guanylate kinase [Chryseobacterium echinoideorum]|uniref:guanylate kinase n=1 Tax=Chryseobacterium echinoideorum TaxID=1549648 RepID=UPI0011869D62|nr:guanylate kinase [Chryseobacterium echinoideorum]